MHGSASSAPRGLEPAAVRAGAFVAGLPRAASDDATVERATLALDAVDPRGGAFPGSRGPDMLVAYTPAYGPRTGTNEWGAEAVIVEGLVVRLGGNDSPIPPNGWVVSGHERGKNWILDNLLLGDEVEREGATLTRRRTARSRLWRAHYLGERAAAAPVAAPTAVQAAELDAALAAARRAIAASAPEADALARQALARAESAYYAARASKPVEGRGAWLRILPEGPMAVERLVETLERTRMNLVFPETVYYGRTIYPPAADSPLAQWPEFAGRDPLAELIALARPRGIEVHAWCHVFFVGFEDSPLVARHPEWLALDRNGQAASAHEVGYYYFQPSNPEARAFLLRTLEDLVRRYDLDGLQLDYIRYPNVPEGYPDYDYAEDTRRRFRAATGHDPLDLTPASDPEARARWTRFREEAVDSFVAEAAARLKAIRPGLQISADIFPNLEDARATKHQNWRTWIEAGWLDFVCPMAYYTDAEPVADATHALRDALGDAVVIHTGVGPYLGLQPGMVVEQVEATRAAGADGVVFFSLNDMTEPQLRALESGVFREPATIPAPRPPETHRP